MSKINLLFEELFFKFYFSSESDSSYFFSSVGLQDFYRTAFMFPISPLHVPRLRAPRLTLIYPTSVTVPYRTILYVTVFLTFFVTFTVTLYPVTRTVLYGNASGINSIEKWSTPVIKAGSSGNF